MTVRMAGVLLAAVLVAIMGLGEAEAKALDKDGFRVVDSNQMGHPLRPDPSTMVPVSPTADTLDVPDAGFDIIDLTPFGLSIDFGGHDSATGGPRAPATKIWVHDDGFISFYEAGSHRSFSATVGSPVEGPNNAVFAWLDDLAPTTDAYVRWEVRTGPAGKEVVIEQRGYDYKSLQCRSPLAVPAWQYVLRPDGAVTIFYGHARANDPNDPRVEDGICFNDQTERRSPRTTYAPEIGLEREVTKETADGPRYRFESIPIGPDWTTTQDSYAIRFHQLKDPVAAFSGEAQGTTWTFTDTSTDSDGTVSSWYWDFGDGTNSTAQHPTHRFIPGSYTVRLTVWDDDGASATVTKTVTAPCQQACSV